MERSAVTVIAGDNELTDVRSYLLSELRALALANENALECQVIKDDCGRTTNGKRSWKQWVIVQAEVRLDLGRKFISKVKKPTPQKRQMTVGPCSLFFAPPVIQRLQKLSLLFGTLPRQFAVSAENERISWIREQDIEASQFTAARGTLEKKGISRGKSLIEPAQLIRTEVPRQDLSQML